MTTHKFKCKTCNITFAIDSQEADVNKAVKEIPARCPKCLKIWGEKGSNIEHQFIPPTAKKSMEVKRRENIEASKEATIQAQQYRDSLPSEEMVTVTPTKDKIAENPNTQPQQVPKKVVDSIQKKLE